jgi:hypothetical protein
LESNGRYFRRRASEEYAAAQRAVTAAARDRHLDLAQRFLSYLGADEASEMLFEWGLSTKKTKVRPVAMAAKVDDLPTVA